MRKNKTGGRRYFSQRIVEAEKRYDGKPNPRFGTEKQITHQLVPKDPPISNLWGLK
jgi:hypothetical protein